MTHKKNKEERQEILKLFEEAQKRLEDGKELSGEDGVMRPLLKKLLEAGLNGEMDAHLKQSKPNRRNGSGSKKLKTTYGPLDLTTPRDRESSFEPKLVEKRQRTLGASLDNKLLSLYSLGMSYRDIRQHMDELYGVDVSPALLTAVTDQIWDEVEQWRNRMLEDVYACVWLDAMVFKVRQDGQVIKKAVYMALGLRMDGSKELLGMYIGQNESAKFWMQVLSDFQQRGVQDILMCCVDNLSGFVQAIQSIFPQTDIQLCIVHQVRNSLKYVIWKDQREVIKDLKAIYKAKDEPAGLKQLDKAEEKWGAKYKAMIKSWRNNWSEISTLFNYPQAIRRMIYTTNMIEGFHRQVRKVTKTKGAFASDGALYKLLYLAQKRITADWNKRQRKDWKEILNILAITYEDRLRKCGYI